jgi:hypothetical protein
MSTFHRTRVDDEIEVIDRRKRLAKASVAGCRPVGAGNLAICDDQFSLTG